MTSVSGTSQLNHTCVLLEKERVGLLQSIFSTARDIMTDRKHMEGLYYLQNNQRSFVAVLECLIALSSYLKQATFVLTMLNAYKENYLQFLLFASLRTLTSSLILTKMDRAITRAKPVQWDYPLMQMYDAMT